MNAPLDPVIAQIIPLLPLRDPETMTPQSARDSLRALAAARAAVPPPQVASVRDTEVRGAATPLAARVYRVSRETSPTVVFFHGGGWVAGDLKTHDRQARLLAIETGAVVVSVDYRRPPETRFPGAFEDSFAAARDTLGGSMSSAETIHASASPATARAAIWRQRSRSAAAMPASISPRNCWSIPSPTSPAATRTRPRTRASLAGGKRRRLFPVARGDAVVRRSYLEDARHGEDWRVSPLRAKSLAGLAPAVVCTAWFDPLRDEGKAYAEALAAADVPTKYHHGAGLIHGYFGLRDASETARLEAQRARADFKTMLERAT